MLRPAVRGVSGLAGGPRLLWGKEQAMAPPGPPGPVSTMSGPVIWHRGAFEARNLMLPRSCFVSEMLALELRALGQVQQALDIGGHGLESCEPPAPTHTPLFPYN